MSGLLPVSIIKKQDRLLLYFDSDSSAFTGRLSAAYLVDGQIMAANGTDEISITGNNFFTAEEVSRVRSMERKTGLLGNGYTVVKDISGVVNDILSGQTENNGLLVSHAAGLFEPGIMLQQGRDIIYPDRTCFFYEKEISLSGYRRQLETPWFYCGASETITFMLYNAGHEDVTVHLENSPDAVNVINDAQHVRAKTSATVCVTPYKFSKFIRLVVQCEVGGADCVAWFQTQLKMTAEHILANCLNKERNHEQFSIQYRS